LIPVHPEIIKGVGNMALLHNRWGTAIHSWN